MSVSGVFSGGRPVAHPNVRAILKYLPRPRVPWQPSQFNRENMLPEDLYKFWGQGRYRSGYMNFNSGYYAGKTHTVEEKTYNIIPKAELEKFMPDISIGPKALVTPVSLMSARAGHRVTHDLLHSYDKYIGKVQTDAIVDHDNITPYDPNHVGLNAATVGSAARIYRWLRRGPFFQENHYFRRSLAINKETGEVPTSSHETSLMRKIIRLAQKGHLKAAAEEYRKVTSIPPVAVYRALTAACIPHARLADAIAIFEDGNSRLFYVSRDGEVLCNLMRCAIAAKHRRRVMWVYNLLRGRFYENVLVRAEIEPIWQYRIIVLALEYLLDINAGEESRVLYDYLVESKMLDFDVHLRIGQLMQEALQAGKTIEMNNNIFNGVALVKNAKLVAPEVAITLYTRHLEHTNSNENENENESSISSSMNSNILSVRSQREWNASRPMCSPLTMMKHNTAKVNSSKENEKQVSTKDASDENEDKLTTDAALAWMHVYFPDVDVEAVMRLARFRRNKFDLMAKKREAYLHRAARWIELLSETHRVREEIPLPYLMKSKPSLTNEKVRVAYDPLATTSSSSSSLPSLLAHSEGYSFYYTPSMRMVRETFKYVGETLQARYLAQIPHHSEIPVAASFHELKSSSANDHNHTHMALPSPSTAAAAAGAAIPLHLSSSLPSTNNATLLSSSSRNNIPHIVHDSVMDEVLKHARSSVGNTSPVITDRNNTVCNINITNQNISNNNNNSSSSDVGVGSGRSLVSTTTGGQISPDNPEF